MNVTGKVLKASVIVTRDSHEVELRIAVDKGGAYNPHLPSSDYVGQVASVAIIPETLAVQKAGAKVRHAPAVRPSVAEMSKALAGADNAPAHAPALPVLQKKGI